MYKQTLDKHTYDSTNKPFIIIKLKAYLVLHIRVALKKLQLLAKHTLEEKSNNRRQCCAKSTTYSIVSMGDMDLGMNCVLGED